MNRDRAAHVALAFLSVLGGLLVLLVAVDLFPYHSSNHDEGVYLQHARLLLGGELWFSTPYTDAFHHWFFVEEGDRLYSKYQPVVPAVFALGVAIGAPRLVLAVVGAGIVALVGLLTREAFDARTGIVASAIVVATPLYLINTALFLPYATTTVLNLSFAYAYVRGVKARSRRWATLAGLAVGLAFFARPYTALLFALPFVVHALWTCTREPRAAVRHHLPTGVLGVAFVGLALAYNLVLTGDALTFPYQAFAPRDGIGFGTREILGYSREYTVSLALEANARVLWEFATRWVAAPPFGAVAALGGLAVATFGLRGFRPGGFDIAAEDLRVLLAGVVLTVVVGNVAFWGNLNVLASLEDPTDGLIAQMGPFYHYDLLLPLGAFGAVGLLAAFDTLRAAIPFANDQRVRATLLAVLLVTAPVAAGAQTDALSPVVEENRAYTERYESAYEPFPVESENALVFVPAPYGEWLGHPFQSLYNDPGLDGDVVYALDRRPDDDWPVIDAYPDRELYRYTYRGEWTPEPDPVEAHIQPLDVREGTTHTIRFETGVLGSVSTVRLADGDDAVSYDVTERTDGTLTLTWTVSHVDAEGRARVVGENVEPRGAPGIDFEGSDELSLAVTYIQQGGATVTYRQELAVDVTDEEVRIVWPPEVEVCPLTPDCGHEGMYVPGGEYIDGVAVNQTIATR
ncbi:ArnT family glycosyltransferase [Natronomonas sp. EA1]|uniref:ArnT family glycosyltransferase n=1 Tax=Natronomonas sp. EA1 TaxID=3421655 RepID=UPI003EBDB113